jgi:hypothetical protein
MGIEKKFSRPRKIDRLNGLLQIAVATGAIYIGMIEYNNRNSNQNLFNHTLKTSTENTYQRTTQQNTRTVQSNNEINDNTLNGFLNKYKSPYRHTPREIVELKQEAGDVFYNTVPFILIASGVALGISGISFLTNRTYRRRYY